MKKFKFIAFLLFATMLSVNFTSCGDDEPSDDPSISVTKEVDLGLPSGTIWAGWNVGANSPEEYGGYYAWGETEEKECYDRETYVGGNAPRFDFDQWTGGWHIPNNSQVDELIDNCTWTWITYKGVNGYKVTGPNGNSIFLPAAGWREGMSLSNANIVGQYYLYSQYEDYGGNFAYYLSFNEDGYHNADGHYPIYGRSIRPVK